MKINKYPLCISSIVIMVLILIAIMIVACNESYAEVQPEFNHEIEQLNKEKIYIMNTREVKNIPTFESQVERDIFLAAEEAGFDPYTALAISAVETGKWDSDAYIYGYNFGGLTGEYGVMSFSTYEEGLNAFIQTLSYYTGLSVDGMAHIYCPPNAAYWSELVNTIRNEYLD